MWLFGELIVRDSEKLMNNILKNINFATRKIIFAFLFDGAAPFLFLRIKIEKEDTAAYTVHT